jgi:hypothetical protein
MSLLLTCTGWVQVRAAEQVHAQLEFFRTDMLKDAAAQRRRVAATALAAAERAGAVVGATRRARWVTG